ncbi:WG repeat-containing protein [Xanthocytophaga flava]|uniref:WG repeat-containing protein n=1 Tax=Xanthocytophaga flava TaxID=3048013 RepID=UPI0028D13C47|nr:WG repeat-containing protein [Xanthocytophaga flavus]MDJ1467496.1 WG repeat-containing protein [Xanthocytophaga flavus]
MCICISSTAYADRVTSALKKLRKNHTAEARLSLNKVLRKQPKNAGAKYVYALYFLYHYSPVQAQATASLTTTFTNTEIYLDSAYAYVLEALVDYPQTERSSLKSWKKAGIDLTAIEAKKREIDSLAYVIAEGKNSIPGFQSFIDRFPEALQKAQAIEKRNELAYAEASRINTYKSYKKFLDTYPDARQAHEAVKLYDLLLFEFLTQDDDIVSYEKFLEVEPNSPYRGEAERRLFELSTLSHTRQTYYDFIQRYPKSPYVEQAWYWIFSLYKKEDNPIESFLTTYPDFFDKAYIEKRIATQPLAYFPVYNEENEKFGFIDANGKLQIEAKYDSVDTEYFCDGVKDNTMLVYRQNRLGSVDKTGKEITGFGYESIEPLEGELLLVKQEGKVGVWHESGFAVLPVQYEEVDVLNETFLLVKQDGKYGLTNFFGGKVADTEFEEIKNLEDGLIAFKQNRRYAIIRNQRLLFKKFPTLEFLYDSVDWIRQDALKVKIGDYESIINSELQTIVTPVAAQLKPLPNAWIAQYEKYQQLLNNRGKLLADSLDEVRGNNSFYATRRGDFWAIWKTNISPRLKFDYDTVMLLGQDGFAVKKGTVFYGFFAPDAFLKLGNFVKISLLQLEGQQSRRWILVEDKAGAQGLLSAKGQAILPVKYDKIVLWTPDLIAVEAGGKWGLMDGNGKQILPLLYSALNYENGFVSTLKNGKFGLLHLERGIDIPPQYERLIKPYTDNSLLFVAAKNGKYGFVTADNEPASDFIFDEINYWQYGVALVKKGDQWQFYQIAEKKYTLKPVDAFEYIQQDDKEIIMRLYANKQYGIVSNTRGIVVDLEYDDLRNVGTKEIPFYLGEKYIDTADVYLIFYIDRDGKKVHKQLFDQQRYDRIVCD